MTPAPIPNFQLVVPADAETIANLHARSWRSAYRGILSDRYLDQEADRERHDYWQTHITAGGDDSFGLLMLIGNEPAGFAYVDREDSEFGNLLDNLHVLPQFKGQGLGRTLMQRLVAEILERDWMPRLHLWVYEDNTLARAFYDRMNGEPVERKLFTTLDNQERYQWRYLWRNIESGL